MEDKCTFKVAQTTLPALRRLRRWCKFNRVPLGRLLNAMIQQAQDLPPYALLQEKEGIMLIIPLPRQVDLDNHLKYLRGKKRYVTSRSL
jgi:hypothetical protein